jgi:hypothetical protein
LIGGGGRISQPHSTQTFGSYGMGSDQQ